MEVDEATLGVIAEKVNNIESHMESMNGTVADLVKESYIQQGMLGMMRWVMVITLSVITAAGTISGIVIAVQQTGG